MSRDVTGKYPKLKRPKSKLGLPDLDHSKSVVGAQTLGFVGVQRPDDSLRGSVVGHASKTVTDDYARQLREDLPFRQGWAERVGLGFSIDPETTVSTLST